jgi:hypothetical protein
MKAKTAILCLASLLALPAFAGATLAPNYTLTFYGEPNLTAGSTYCLEFTTTGTIMGYKQSGTYTDSTGVITGTWYINGDEVLMTGYGVSYGDSVPFVGRLLVSNNKFAGRYLDFDASTNVFYSGGTFVATKVTSCPAADVRHQGPAALE